MGMCLLLLYLIPLLNISNIYEKIYFISINKSKFYKISKNDIVQSG